MLFAKNTFQCPVSLFGHAINTLFLDVAIGASLIVGELLGGSDVGGGGGAFEPGLDCAKAVGSNDIATVAAVKANAAAIITTDCKEQYYL